MTTNTLAEQSTEKKVTKTKAKTKEDLLNTKLIVIYKSLDDYGYNNKDDIYYILDDNENLLPYPLNPGVNIVNAYYTEIFLKTDYGKNLKRKNIFRYVCDYTQKSISTLDLEYKEEILANSFSEKMLREWATFDSSYAPSIAKRLEEINEEKNDLLTIYPKKIK